MRRMRAVLISGASALALAAPAAASADATATSADATSADATATCAVDGTTVTDTGTTASCSLGSGSSSEASDGGVLACAVVASGDATDLDSSAGAVATTTDETLVVDLPTSLPGADEC